MPRLLLIFLLLCLAGWSLARSVRRSLRSPLGRQLAELWRALSAAPGSGPAARRPRPSQQPAQGELERCEQCQNYVPENRGVREGGRFLCDTCRSA